VPTAVGAGFFCQSQKKEIIKAIAMHGHSTSIAIKSQKNTRHARHNLTQRKYLKFVQKDSTENLTCKEWNFQ
jgi:hypothetical protein